MLFQVQWIAQRAGKGIGDEGTGSLTGTSRIKCGSTTWTRIVDGCRLGWLALLLGLSGPYSKTQVVAGTSVDVDRSYLAKHLLLVLRGREEVGKKVGRRRHPCWPCWAKEAKRGGQEGKCEGRDVMVTDRARTDCCALTASRNKWRLPSAMVRPLTGRHWQALAASPEPHE